MSSAYPPPGGQLIRRCFRCGTPLPPNGAVCGNCGAYNAVPQNGRGQVQAAQGQAYGQAPLPVPGPPQVQAPATGSLWGYANNAAKPAAPTQAQFAAWGQPSAASVPGTYAPPVQPSQSSQFQPFPFTTTVAGMPAPNQGVYTNGLMSGVGSSNGYYQGAQAPQGLASSVAPGFANNYSSLDYYQDQQEKRGPGRIGLMIVIGLLLLLVIGGGLTGVLYYSSHDQSTPAATPTVVITTPTIKPLFRDTFTNNSTGWQVTSGQGKFSAQVGGGLMTLEDDDNKLLWDILPGKTFSDFRLDVDARLTKGDQNNAYGVYIRGASTATSNIGTYYRLEIYGDGTFAIYKGIQDSNGNTQNNRVTYQANAAIHKEGQFNHITVIARGGTMVFMVNGVTVYTYPDTSYRGGLIAMFVSNLPGLAPGAQATFANLAIFPAS